jgi:hypothetical protein
MTNWTTKRAIAALRCVLGVVVLWASGQLLWATIVKIQAATEPGRVGLHAWTLLLLASVEIVGAIMLLAPVLNVAGSDLLLAVFAFGIFFHLLQRQLDVGALLVYGVAVLVWLAHRREAQTGVRDEHRS